MVSGNVVADNKALGAGPPAGFGSPFGAIIVATNANNTVIRDTTVINNDVNGSLVMGIVVDSDWPGSIVANTLVMNNDITNTSASGILNTFENSKFTPTNTTGILVCTCGLKISKGMSSPPVDKNTMITSNTINDDVIGVWLCGSSDTTVSNLRGILEYPVAVCPALGGT